MDHLVMELLLFKSLLNIIAMFHPALMMMTTLRLWWTTHGIWKAIQILIKSSTKHGHKMKRSPQLPKKRLLYSTIASRFKDPVSQAKQTP